MYAVIMAGGSGTRFWPASRHAKPKQLLELWGDPMILRTVRNLEVTVAAADQLVITGGHLVNGVLDAVPDLTPRNVIAEPVGRNTAPVVGLAAALLQKDHGDVVFGVFPSDHIITDQQAWKACLDAAEAAAEKGPIVTLGIRPTRPETGYGYIKYVDGAESGLQSRRVERFVEKPNQETAQQYLAEGTYLWNAGIFVAKTSTILNEVARQMPELHTGLMTLADSWGTASWDETLANVFPTLPSISVDYGIMEGAECIEVVPASFDWSDVGHWAALDETMETDDDKNVVIGDALTVEARGNVIINQVDEKLVVLMGVDDLVVVDVGDALLVAPRARAQDIKAVVQQLKETGHHKLL